jgi:hypothetical protein
MGGVSDAVCGSSLSFFILRYPFLPIIASLYPTSPIFLFDWHGVVD